MDLNEARERIREVDEEMAALFVRRMEAVFGAHSCYVLDVRPEGAAIVFNTTEE